MSWDSQCGGVPALGAGNLAARYPWLERALVDAYRQEMGTLPAAKIERKDLRFRLEGGMEPWRAGNIVRNYKQRLQFKGPAAPASSGWELLGDGVRERARWVTPQRLRDRLGPRLIETRVKDDVDVKRSTVVQSVLRAPGQFVAVVNDSGNFVRLINRRDFADRTLRAVADNP